MVLPSWQIESRSEAAKYVEGGGGPDFLNALLNPLHHAHAHVVLLLGGHDPLVEIINLLVQPEIRTNITYIQFYNPDCDFFFWGGSIWIKYQFDQINSSHSGSTI